VYAAAGVIAIGSLPVLGVNIARVARREWKRHHPHENRMAFPFRLETTDGAPADPPTLTSAVPNWSSGDAIPLGAGKMLRVVEVRDEDAEQPPVLVVEAVGSESDAARTASKGTGGS
jgi:hypothetical protein